MTRSKDLTPHYKFPSTGPLNPLIRSYNESDGFSSATRWSYSSACLDLFFRAIAGLTWAYTRTIGSPLASYIIANIEHLIADPGNCSSLSALLFTVGTLAVSLMNVGLHIDKDILLKREATAPVFWTCDRYNWYASRGPANESLVWSTLIGAVSSSASTLVVMSMMTLLMTSAAVEKGKYARGSVILLVMNIITNALLFQPSAGSTCLTVQGNGISTVRIFEMQRFIYWGSSMPVMLVMLASEAGLKGSSIVNAWFAQLIAVICCAVAYLQMRNRSLLVPFSAIAVCAYCYVTLILLKSLSISGTGLVESFRIIHAGINNKKKTTATTSDVTNVKDVEEERSISLDSFNPITKAAIQKEETSARDQVNRALVTLTVRLMAPAFFAIWYCYPLLIVLSGINLLEPAMEVSLFTVLEIVTIILFACYCILEKSARTDDLVAEQLVNVTHHRELVDAGKTAKQGFMRLVFHELRIPLNALSLGLDDVFANIGLLQELETHRETNPHLPPQQEHRVIVRDMVVSTSILIENVVAMTRLLDEYIAVENTATEGGCINLINSSFSPVDMARESMRLVTSPAGLKRVSLDLVVHKDVPSVITGDENRLKQVLNNLLSNALKFSCLDSRIIVRLTVCQAVADSTTCNKEDNPHNATSDNDSVLNRLMSASLGATASELFTGTSRLGSSVAAAGLSLLLASFKASSKITPAPPESPELIVDVPRLSTSEKSDAYPPTVTSAKEEGNDQTVSITIAVQQQQVQQQQHQDDKDQQRIHKFIRFDIVDSGPGIADDDKAELFKPFSEPIKGGGAIGLSICKRIIELSGGVIGVENNLASKETGSSSSSLSFSGTVLRCGSTFFFAVPVDSNTAIDSQNGQQWRLIPQKFELQVQSSSAAGVFVDSTSATGARGHLRNSPLTDHSDGLKTSSAQPLNGRVDSMSRRYHDSKRGKESPPMFKRQGKSASSKPTRYTEEKQPAVLHVSMPSSSSTSLVDRYGKSSSSTFAFESPAQHRPHLGTGKLDVFPPPPLPFPSPSNSLQSTPLSSPLMMSQSSRLLCDQRSTLRVPVSSGQVVRDQYYSQAVQEPTNKSKKQPVDSTAVDLVDVAREDDNDDDTTALLTSCLLVDSIESSRTFMKRLLTRRGVSTVHCVSSGEEALNLFRELSQSERNDVQVCFIEYEMPHQNGSELTARLRAEPLCITCPIIGITGSELEESRRMFQTAGASAIITAPIRADILAYTLRHFNLIWRSD